MHVYNLFIIWAQFHSTLPAAKMQVKYRLPCCIFCTGVTFRGMGGGLRPGPVYSAALCGLKRTAESFCPSQTNRPVRMGRTKRLRCPIHSIRAQSTRPRTQTTAHPAHPARSNVPAAFCISARPQSAAGVTSGICDSGLHRPISQSPTHNFHPPFFSCTAAPSRSPGSPPACRRKPAPVPVPAL